MKLFNVTKSEISEEFHNIMLEGNKADWIAINQGDKLIKKGKEYGDHMMVGKTAQEIGDYLEKEGGKFAPYMSQLYIRGDVTKMEDMYQINQLVKKFNAVSKHLDNKDITRYSLDELHKALEPFEGQMSNNHVNPVKDKELEDSGHITKLISAPNFEVVVSHSKEASCYLGGETDVCTAADDDHNYHDHYDADGNLYTVRAGNRRYLLHFESGQFKDEKNRDLTDADIEYLSSFDPYYADFLNLLSKKHYFTEKGMDKAIAKRQKKTGATPQNAHLERFNSDDNVVKESTITKDELREIAMSPQKSYEYARDVVDGRFKLGEAAIKTSSKYSILYARDVLKESYNEASIAKDAKKSYFYAKNVLEGRFQLGEAAIRANPEYTQLYVKNILKSS